MANKTLPSIALTDADRTMTTWLPTWRWWTAPVRLTNPTT